MSTRHLLPGVVAIGLVACAGEPTDPTPVAITNARSETPIPITECGTVITQPGTYIIAASISCNILTGPPITIRSSDVTLLSGNVGLESPGPCISVGVGVPGGVERVRIIGIDARICSDGILFENVRGGLIKDVLTRWNGAGIRITGTPDLSRADTIIHSESGGNPNGEVVVDAGTGIVIIENFLDYGLWGGPGIVLNNAQGTRILRNLVRHHADGIIVGPEARHTVVEDNRVEGDRVGWIGITVDGQASLIRNNTISDQNYGIVGNGRSNRIVGNTVTGTWGEFDLYSYALECYDNIWRENRYQTASLACMD